MSFVNLECVQRACQFIEQDYDVINVQGGMMAFENL